MDRRKLNKGAGSVNSKGFKGPAGLKTKRGHAMLGSGPATPGGNYEKASLKKKSTRMGVGKYKNTRKFGAGNVLN